MTLIFNEGAGVKAVNYSAVSSVSLWKKTIKICYAEGEPRETSILYSVEEEAEFEFIQYTVALKENKSIFVFDEAVNI